ncbi:MAG TPA: hypothetical protein PKY56_02895 [Candidatus Kapabacteria bacterium]|nr:hypothetical protein [Candidatus Kapabacteria bacterium]HPO62412.1 hypothetical protein [Candidatus Kapabacteria bacterium]
MEKLIIAVEGETDKTIFSKFMKDLPLSLISQISIKEFNGFSGVMKSLNENTIFGIVDNDKDKQIILNDMYDRISHNNFSLKAIKTDEIKDVLILNPAPEKILFQEAIGCNITIQDFFSYQ